MMNLPATAACPRPLGRAAWRKAPRRRLHFLVPLLFVAVTTLTGAAAPAPPVDYWQAGVATVDVTPPLPAWLSGYGNRVAPAKTITEPLRAKALAIKDRTGTTLVAITTDLLGIPRAVRDAVAGELHHKYRLPGSGLLINASHTHCGPEIRSAETEFSTLDPQRTAWVAEYRALLVGKLAEVAGTALSSLEPAHLAYSHAKAGFAMNRRPNFALVEGMPGYGVEPNPDGPVDHAVPVLQVRNAKGELKALLFGYACHPTTAKMESVHADYPGFAQQALQKIHPGAVALFLQGCAGDQNPFPRHGTVPGYRPIELARSHGQTLALAVVAALGTQPHTVSGPLVTVFEDVSLPYATPPTRVELEQLANSERAAVRDFAKARLEKFNREGRLPDSYRYPIQVVKFGDDLTLVALASEVVVDFSHRLKRELPGRLWVSAYNNDFCGYIPSRRVWHEGGYEGGESIPYGRTVMWRQVHSNKWDVSVEDRIVAKTHELYLKAGRAAAIPRP